jgi:hypothetical protein
LILFPAQIRVSNWRQFQYATRIQFYRQFIALIILLSLSVSIFAQAKKPTSGGQAKTQFAFCSNADDFGKM